MSQGRAERKVSYPVAFFDWNRFNINETTALAAWTQSLGVEVNSHFTVNEAGNGLQMTTTTGEVIDVKPGSVIMFSEKDLTFHIKDAISFDREFNIIEEVEDGS